METYSILKDLALIIIAAELFGLLARKFKAPHVVGQIVAGLLIGPSMLGFVEQSDFINKMAEIGVVLLMFSAGLETNLKDLVKTGPKAFAIACVGVFIPLGGGFLLSSYFHGFAPVGSIDFIKNVFIGVIMTATSVSITVQALREMGRLKGVVGTTILSAAIIDDIIGIIVLTFVIGLKDPSSNFGKVIGGTALFFITTIIIGFLLYQIFKRLDKKFQHHRRIPILSLFVCFGLAYIAEKFFGIADITGAYAAGIILCNLYDADYIARRTDISSYMIFGPIFFCSIGLKTQITDFSIPILLFSVAFVLVALITKIIGCGFVSRLCKFNRKDSLKIGLGMMTRGEVALIVSQKGLSVGLLEAKYFTAVILLIIVSSIIAPILLKLLYRGEPLEKESASA